jgi:hypothetical protein
MGSSVLLALRTGIVLLFLIVMPLLALPPFARRVDMWWQQAWEVVPQQFGLTVQNDDDPEPANQASLSTAHQSSASGLIGESQETEPSVSEKDRVAAIHDQLIRLGAAQTRLESNPDGEPAFRFVCEFPVEDSVYTRAFQQAHDDPLVAMEGVLDKVKSWQRGGTLRLQATNTRARLEN